MSNVSAKSFDAVDMVRTMREALSSTIATMSVEDENRWLRSAEYVDPTLRRLMDAAAQQRASAGGEAHRG
jgi:hypothetical protein